MDGNDEHHLQDTIARLTAERDELLREAEGYRKIITRLSVERREMWASKERAEADLASAITAIHDMLVLWDEECAGRYVEEPAPISHLRAMFGKEKP